MAKLHAAERKKLPDSVFGLPKERKYPTDTKGRARAAKAYASKEEHKGVISKSEENQIDRKADRKLGKGHHEPMGHGAGGAAKSKHIGHHSDHKNVVNAHSHKGKLDHE